MFIKTPLKRNKIKTSHNEAPAILKSYGNKSYNNDLRGF